MRMATKGFALLAAVEVSGGQTAISDHGRTVIDREFGDPVADAKAWVEQGASWIHLADLDAGAAGTSDREVLAAVAHAVKGKAAIEVVGGIRTDADVKWARGIGAARVVFDIDADPAWLGSQYRALGHRCGVMMPIHKGHVQAPGAALHGVAAAVAAKTLAEAGCPGILVCDIDREGTRKGPEVELLRSIAQAAGVPVVAAGGVARLEHLHALLASAPDGVAGAVLDAALYRDYFSVAEAIAAVEPRFDPYQWGPAQPWGLTQGLY